MEKYLVIIDMQNDFISGSLSCPCANEAANKIATYLKIFDGNILFTQDWHDDNLYLDTREGKELPIKHCIANTWGSEIDSRLLPYTEKENAHIIKKSTFAVYPDLYYDYFWPNNDHLDGSNLEIEICGTLLDICVISNALLLRSLFPEAKIKLLSKLCGYRDAMDLIAVHRIARACQIEIIY